jgi:hypothetical protein
MTNLIERMAASVPSWGARIAYGEKTSLNGHEILPVALVIFGFGGGEGSGTLPEGDKQGEGSGGGGGGYTMPIGAYVGSSSGLTFRPNPIALILVVAPLVSAFGLAFARLRR